MFNNFSYIHQFVFPEGDPAGPQYVDEWNKLVCTRFILLCVLCCVVGIDQSV